jgi:hypothetical protein
LRSGQLSHLPPGARSFTNGAKVENIFVISLPPHFSHACFFLVSADSKNSLTAWHFPHLYSNNGITNLHKNKIIVRSYNTKLQIKFQDQIANRKKTASTDLPKADYTSGLFNWLFDIPCSGLDIQIACNQTFCLTALHRCVVSNSVWYWYWDCYCYSGVAFCYS